MSVTLNNTGVIKRLGFLARQIGNYRHFWQQLPAVKLEKWSAEYDRLRNDHPEAWLEYCRLTDRPADHDALALAGQGSHGAPTVP